MSSLVCSSSASASSSSLTERQAKFLDDLAQGPRGLRELMEDYQVSRKEFRQWEEERAFAEELEEVFGWLQFVREVEIRVGATEALRKQRMYLEGHDLHLSSRQRMVGRELIKEARALDRQFPRRFPTPGGRRPVSPVHPEQLREAVAIVARMEELHRAALAARAAEKEGRLPGAAALGVTVEVKCLPAPVEVDVVDACEGKEGSD